MKTTMKNKPLTYLRPSEAAEYARVNRATIYRWLTAKKLRGYLVGGTRLFKLADIDALIEGGASK
jgi:excisionase family DNA binding protein